MRVAPRAVTSAPLQGAGGLLFVGVDDVTIPTYVLVIPVELQGFTIE